MLCLSTVGGLAVYPTILFASVTQSQTIKVQGKVVDEQGEPLIGVPQFGITECLIQYKCSVNTPPPHAIRSG